MDAAAAAAEVTRAAGQLAGLAVAVAFAGCAATPASDDGPRILRRWDLAAPPGLGASAPAAAVVGTAAEWGRLRARWGLPADALPAGACDFVVARCLFVVAPAAAPMAAAWGTEEGVDVLTLAAAAPGAPTGLRLHGFVLARRLAQLAVVYRPAAGAEVAVWVDPGTN